MSKDIIRLSGVIKNSIVDGPGFRLTVFCQGCPHHCEGCHNEKTWDFDGGFDGKVEKIINVAKSLPLLQGLTFSGGEPFCQAEAFAELGRLAHENGYNVVTYTGYTYEKLLEGADKHPEWMDLLKQTDYLIDGRFILDEKSLMLKFRGSRNQRIIDVKKSLESNQIVENYDI